jgi:hypothetical protein
VNPPPNLAALLDPTTSIEGVIDGLNYPYFQAVWDRKSRRVGVGMEIATGPLSYTSPYEPVPLSETEEALLLMSATGLNGLNLGDIDPTQGADAMVQWTARTWPSSCSNHGTELFFTNDDGLYFLDMWKLMPEPGELSTFSGKPIEQQIEKAVEITRRAKVKLHDGRAELPTGLPGLFVFNHWNANKPGSTLFIPVSNMTLEYINLLFIYLSPEYKFSIVDERNGYASAGLQESINSGDCDPARQMGMIDLETRVLSMQVVEQAFICQNLNMALQCLGLGGWTYTGYIARFMLGAMDVAGLGFRFHEARQGPSVPVGRDGIYEGFTIPYFADMHEAVDAFMEVKWSQYDTSMPKSYTKPDEIIRHIQRPDRATIDRVKAYCQYVVDTYGRFPAYIDPMYQRLTCQAQHVDPDFYDEHYPPGACTDQHHQHFTRWHPDLAGPEGKPPRRATTGSGPSNGGGGGVHQPPGAL